MRLRALVVLFLTIAIPVAGCVRVRPIYNVKDAPLAPSPGAAPTREQVSQAIWSAGKQLGWRMEEVRPGEMTGTLKLRSHVAVVAILYDASRFSITYKDSTNLMQSDGEIHRNYNNWIHNLEQRIQAEAARIPVSR